MQTICSNKTKPWLFRWG